MDIRQSKCDGRPLRLSGAPKVDLMTEGFVALQGRSAHGSFQVVGAWMDASQGTCQTECREQA